MRCVPALEDMRPAPAAQEARSALTSPDTRAAPSPSLGLSPSWYSESLSGGKSALEFRSAD